MAHPNRRFKTAIFEQFARIGKAISNPSRLELLDLLCQATVEALAKEANLGLANTSQHLKALKNARLVEAEKSGLFVTYRLADEQVCQFFRSLQNLAETRLTEVREITRDFLANHHGLEPVDRDALLTKVREGAVTVLDVRPAEEYRAGHIPGALSIPLKELSAVFRTYRGIAMLSPTAEALIVCWLWKQLTSFGRADSAPFALRRASRTGGLRASLSSLARRDRYMGDRYEQPVYLDYNATTPHAPEVVAAMRPFKSPMFFARWVSRWIGLAERSGSPRAGAQPGRKRATPQS